MLRTLLSAILILGLAAPLFPSDSVAGQGPPMNRIYAHDEIYTGVNAPRDLPNQGKFDAIYVLGPGMMPVSETAPGDADYNGGRWEVRVVTFTGMSPTQFTNAEQIEQAHAAGTIALSDVVRRFECPLIPQR
jgi:hypothetical protein